MDKNKQIANIKAIEITEPGYSNGISTQLKALIDKGEYRSLNSEEKQEIIKNAEKAYGEFLDALGCDWRNDPNSMKTPYRVSKAYLEDLWKGRYELPPSTTSFPSKYHGIVLEKNIPVVSQCSHHHQTILGKAHIAYIPGEEGRVVGLSKLNRIVEHFARRGAIQEELTMAIHNAVDQICTGNDGIMVVIQATHGCVSCRGVKHEGASMMTSEVSGVFADHTRTAKAEVIGMLSLN